jgi:hypothetical protein
VEPDEPENDEGSETPSAQAKDDASESPESPESNIEVPSEEEETEFVAQEKKPANQTALMLFAILLIGGAGIYAMYLRIGVKTARAASVADAQATISDFMSKGTTNVSLLRKLLDGTANIVEQFKAPQVVQVPLGDLKANPFHMASVKVPTGEDAEAAAKKKREDERVVALKAVQALRLQTVVVHGDRKACMINNTLYQEGDTLENFTIERIQPNSVIVKNGPFRFALRMSN